MWAANGGFVSRIGIAEMPRFYSGVDTGSLDFRAAAKPSLIRGLPQYCSVKFSEGAAMSDSERKQILIDGPVGHIQLTIDHPCKTPKGVVLLSHPQPLLGGSPRHIVPLTLARHLSAAGWLVVRPSFRGVDQTEGVHDHGIGEAQDTLAVIRYISQELPQLSVALVGFSFGAHVFARVACTLREQLRAVVLLGLPVGDVPGKRYYEPLPLPQDCLLLHGERDEMAPLANLMNWAAADHRAVSVFAGADHFFKGCLDAAAGQVAAYLEQSRAQTFEVLDMPDGHN
ncbi:alpha/beta hydrolase [Pseudomonas sp. 21LCFQ02]|nr:alpha/beta fold hydrolase [Pseudomonas sp. 21LCFQ02]MCO8168624.1 alpha/beta hydrolase [Pseudomonas sp. 21LCFQ02]